MEVKWWTSKMLLVMASSLEASFKSKRLSATSFWDVFKWCRRSLKRSRVNTYYAELAIAIISLLLILKLNE